MVFALGCLTAAVAGDRVALAVGMAGLAGPPTSAGVAGAGYLAFRLTGPLHLDVGARPGLLAGPTRVFTGVHAAARWHLGERPFLRAGFVHQHETPWSGFASEPVTVSLGASEHIRHRTGLDLGAGVRWPLPKAPLPGVHWSLSASALGFPDAAGPQVYGVLESLLSTSL